MNYLEKYMKKDPNIVSRKILDEVVLVPIQQNLEEMKTIYTLNEVGAFVWALIDGKRLFNEIKDLVIEEFEISPKQAERDLIEFMRQLEEINAIAI